MSIGKFSYSEGNYVPTFPREIRDAQQRLIPCPEYVSFTNLRRYLEYLSNPDTQFPIRENFYNHNPIPRVEWDDGNMTIQNADDIMPANYGPEQLSRDVFAVKEWIEIAADLKGSKNKWFGELKLYQDISGNEGVQQYFSNDEVRRSGRCKYDN